jgi:LysM repeat protein
MRRYYGLLIGLLLCITVPLAAQNSCPALVDQALSAIGDNCAELDRNSACYGFDRVDATFSTPQSDNFFSQPTDRTELTELETIQTYPLDVVNEEFGAAVMNVQANVPDTIPGQGVIFLLLGETNLTNDVDTGNLAAPTPAVSAITNGDTPLFTSPTTTANVRETVAAGTTLNVDAVVPGGAFVRVIRNEEIVWVERTALFTDAAVDALPQVGGNVHSPMQAFYFTTGIGQPACNEAESSVAVQSPEGIEVNLTVNGVDINVGSFVTFTNNTITVHRGGVTTSTGQNIGANETLELERDDEGNFVGTGDLRDINEDEQERGERMQDGVNEVADANGWETQEVTPLNETTESGEIIHIVQAGESLFGIGQLYNASIPAIIQRNGLQQPDFVIFVGQRLVIPNPGSGFVGMPARTLPTDTPTDIPTQTQVDCSGFARLVGGAQFISAFTWSEAPGADEYKVNFYGADGGLVRSVWVKAPATSLSVNMGDLPTGGSFQWEVEALRGGNSFCTTSRSAVTVKPGDPNPPRPPVTSGGSTFTASRLCSAPYSATVDWAGAIPGELITIFAKETGSGTDGGASGAGPSGSTTVGVGFQIAYITVTSASGPSVTLPGC